MERFSGSSKSNLDGSGGQRSSDARLRRCGWGAIVLDFSQPLAPEVVAGCLGPLAGPEQTVPRSELQAAVFVSEVTGPNGVHLLSDNQYVVDRANQPRAASLHGPNGDLWERFWSAVDAKAGNLRVTKVKAHCNEQDVLNGVISPEDYAGNSFADACADSAADQSALPQALLSSFDVIDGAARQVQRRITAIICSGPTKDADDKEASSYKKSKRAEAERLQLALQEQRADDALPPPPPDPPPQVRLGGDRSSGLHRTHRLVCQRGLWWCTTCGCFASARGRGLLMPCLYRATLAGRRALDRLANGQTPDNSVDWPLPL